jgi:methyl-accepting chemotaxis protein
VPAEPVGDTPPPTPATGEHKLVPPPRVRTLVGWIRWALMLVLGVPLVVVAALGWLGMREVARLRAGHKQLAQALDDARAASAEVVKSTYLDRTLALGGEIDRLVRGLPVGAQLPATVEEVLSRARIGRAGAVVLVDGRDRIAWDVDEDLVGRPAGEAYPPLARLLSGARWRVNPVLLEPQPGGFMRDNALAETSLEGAEFYVLVPVAQGRWVVVTHAELDHRNAAALKSAEQSLEAIVAEVTAADERAAHSLTLALAIVLGLGTISMIFVAARFRKRVLAPIRHLTLVAEKIRLGDLGRRTDVRTGDELEALGQSVNAMLDRLARLIAGEEQKQRLERNIKRLLAVVSRAGEGDLTARGERTPDELGPVVEALNQTLESIGGLVAEVRRDGDSVGLAADAILRASERMADGATRQSAAIDQVSRKIAMLGQRSLEVGRIVELVEDIAQRTNMLALNAAIEASRSGGASNRGFAVVAEEVRKLAERSSAATKEIGDFLDSIQEATDEAGRAMADIREVTRRTADDAADQRRVAAEVVEAARALRQAIARLKVPFGDDTAKRRAADILRKKRADLEASLRALEAELAAVDGEGSRG